MITEALSAGVVGSCVTCGKPSRWWAEYGGQYRCVHERWDCLEGMVEALSEVGQAAASRAGRSRGAYARLAARSAAPAAPSGGRVALKHPLSPGSPFFTPGMVDGAPWTAVAETNYGQITVPCGTNEAHARTVVRGWRVLTEAGYEVGNGGRYAVAGTVVDPRGEFTDEWGDVMVLGKPRWSPIQRVRDWSRCTGCSAVLWPGCVVSTQGGRCITCVAATEAEDPRMWPDEPRDPGVEHYPPHLGGPKKKKAAPVGKAES